MSIALTFTPDGAGHALYTEALHLGSIGPLAVRRATRIEFDAEAQYWRVYLTHGRAVLFNSPSREACLAWERRYLESQEDLKHELQHRPGAAAPGA